MMRGYSPKFTVLVALFSFAALSLRSVHAQQESLSIPGISSTAHSKQFVTLANGDAATAAANKPTVVELRFRVDSGLHVHSHTPSSEFYIPTTLTLLPDSGVAVKGIAYPPGQAYSFSAAPKEKLSVYTGEFVVKATVLMPAGSHTLRGTLRYQACDNGSCFPPRTLPVSVVVEAR